MRATLGSYKSSTSEALRVVGALMLREIKTRFGDNQLGFVWIFIEPLLFVIPVVLFWSARGSSSHGIPIVEFIMTGYPPFIIWRNCVSRSLGAISGNSGLLYHRMITPARIVLARCLLEVAACIISIGLTYVVFIYIGWVRPPVAFPFFLFGWIYMGAVAWSSAIFLSALAETSKILLKAIGTINYLMYPIGGAFYMVSWMPEASHKYLVWLPTVQAFELIRYGYFGESIRTFWSPLHMLICVLVPGILGLHVMKTAREHMELE